MRSAETPSSPAFPALDPIIMDDEMESTFRNVNMDFLDPSKLDMPSDSAGGDFDDLFSHVTHHSGSNGSQESFKHYQHQHPLRKQPVVAADSPAESPDASSRSSSSESPRNHLRHASIASSNSAAHSENRMVSNGFTTDDWMRPDLSSVKEESPFTIEPSYPVNGDISMDHPDLEFSNKAMDAAFDFESAASSPSPLKMETSTQINGHKMAKAAKPWKSSDASSVPTSASKEAHSAPSVPRGDTPMYAFGYDLREHTPFANQFTNGRDELPATQWNGQSPSSLLEESFGGINMNGQSPMNTSMSPNVNFGSPHSFPFPGNLASSQAPSQAQPQQADVPKNKKPVLTVHPTSLKSRVETQIPIRLTLSPLPTGVKKLRLPSYTISKLKFLAPPSTETSADTLQLYTSLVCTSAMQDREKLRRAFARTRGERKLSGGSDQDEERPLDGGDVKICAGCIQRERKRASRKKQRKPEEDELFQKDEEKRVIVFNTSEIKEWTEPPKPSATGHGETPPTPPGAMQVELPMRIACYCRHQNEKLGFQVIFTIKDHLNNVVAQAITNSIMITDDHKTQAPSAPPMTAPSSVSDGNQMPGVTVFSSGENSKQGIGAFGSPQSPTDLQGLQQRFNSQYQLTPSSFAAAHNMSNSVQSSSQTPRSLSRQTSPTDFQGPSTKRRKHSNSGRLPSELTMTRMEGGQISSASMGNVAHLAAGRGFASPTERPFVAPSSMAGQLGSGLPTPTHNTENNPFFNPTPAQRQSLDHLAQQNLVSAPNSAQPSRPGTPGGSGRNAFQEQNLALALGATSANQIWPSLTTTPARLPSVIHKLVPAEGSITGGTEVTLLGSGFYPGMEVVFGDTLATTTTFWGDKCLNCLTPPALQPGLVAVVFKHEHPTFGQVQQPQPLMPKQQLFFRYVDDRELQMYRLALNILGQKLGSQADAFQTAQQIMGGDPNAIFNMQKDMSGAGNPGGHQRQVPGHESQGKLSDLDSKMLTYLEYIDLDDNPRPPRYNSRSATGQTLLHLAASLGLTRFVAGLLARGANPDIQDQTGNTPMHLAALHGHAHLINRLRLAGANANARSVRGFTPADLATNLPAHQAALLPSRHYRSRSVGSITTRRRQSSSASLSSLWGTSSSSGSLDHTVDDFDQTDDSEDVDSEDSDTPLYLSRSRRSSVHQDAMPADVDAAEQPAAPDARGFSTAAIVAWRNHLAAQINQFQQSVASAFPNIPALPPMPAMPTMPAMPAMPDYQANQVMRRITNLVPHRPTARDGWWDLLKGNTAVQSQNQPPSYDELYPHQQDVAEAIDMKKSSLLHAAAEAALDQHFEAQDRVPVASSSTVAASTGQNSNSTKDDLKDITIGSKLLSREQQKHLREHQARRMKGLGSDRNLYFIWIPLLLLVMCAWIRNYVPGIWQGVTDAYHFVKSRYAQQAVTAGI
ncbi:hypothetical protein N7539_002719 [Penicillium diatomitis]|uniref:IPT/TIG domain-containing protein n=1 Tax=Penicillium diatomitis TaxID=2819901 RepID=A0A9W9XGF6_9EURO|nr:uncharacterized protein N7539_002719 [Penicillium diatomitis]KAJ5491152.1 hypothetical protein N7539_002719 [Penicillium diatomitis]